jgi:ribosomal protein S18 acetylase RimI-like enzyme
MSKLTLMTQPEYDVFLEQLIPDYAAEHVRAGNWTEFEALEKANKEIEALLPQGLKTADNFFFTLYDSNDAIGRIWMKVKTHPSKSGFIYEVFIEEKYRSKGYGKSLMLLLEEKARELGLQSLGLHVFGSNRVARKLYETIGYEATSMHMVKKLE